MSGSKSCPTCEKQWAATFKFCPEDGAQLKSAEPRAPAEPIAPIQSSRQSAPTTVVSAPKPSKKARRNADKRLLNLEPIADPQSDRPTNRQAAPIVPEQLVPPSARNTAPSAPQPRRTAERKPSKQQSTKSRRRASDFSETAWFMRPIQAVDPKTGRVKVDPDAYRRDDSIPEEKRRRFSLRRKDEE